MNIIEKLTINLIGRNKMFNSIREMLQGKKTYLSAAALVIEALLQYTVDSNLSDLVTKLIAAAGMCSLKAGQARDK